MRVPCWLIFAAFSTSLCFAAAITYHGESAVNLFAIPDFPDRRFGMKVSRTTAFNDMTSCEMTMLTAMGELALMDIKQELANPGAKAWRHPVFRGTILLISPAGVYTGASVRFAIWTLAYSMHDTLTRDLCRSTFYKGTWEEREVVNVNILPDPNAAATPNQTAIVPHHEQIHTHGTVDTIPNNTGSFDFPRHLNRSNDLGSDDLHADITYLGRAMDPRDIIMTATLMMEGLAPINRETLNAMAEEVNAITAKVKYIFNRAGFLLPYDMTFGDLITLVAKLPEHILQDGMWQEMNIAITDNRYPDVVIARGSFRIGGPLSTRRMEYASIED